MSNITHYCQSDLIYYTTLEISKLYCFISAREKLSTILHCVVVYFVDFYMVINPLLQENINLHTCICTKKLTLPLSSRTLSYYFILSHYLSNSPTLSQYFCVSPTLCINISPSLRSLSIFFHLSDSLSQYFSISLTLSHYFFLL